MRQAKNETLLNTEERLFLSIAEQLSRPLTVISRLAELAETAPDARGEYWRTAHAVADSSLRLVESYALSLRVHGNVTPLQLEPVTVSSLLYDTVERLLPLARQYGVALEMDTGPRGVEPVVADRTVLRSAFESLGQVFVTAQAEAEQAAPVYLMAHRSRYGIVAGLYSGTQPVGAESLKRARAVQGSARQPLHSFADGPAAGVFVADHLLQALESRLHAARYRHLTGLAATLMPSRQLQLV